jgi:alginate O-acetyltransferase complex protein AlgI
MDWPVLACSVSDFWGKRWNTAFRDLTHRFLFRPLTARFGAKAGLAVGFLFSGFVHDLVVSAPAQGGYGGPTLFFLLQGAAILFERSATGQRLGLGKGVRGWAFTVVVLLAPLFLLFHPPFVREVIVPFIDWILQAGGSAANPGDSL